MPATPEPPEPRPPAPLPPFPPPPVLPESPPHEARRPAAIADATKPLNPARNDVPITEPSLPGDAETTAENDSADLQNSERKIDGCTGSISPPPEIWHVFG